MRNLVLLSLSLVIAAPLVLAAPQPSRLPDPSLNLKLAAPINTWDEAVPLGNGTMGVLLWGEGSTLRFSLDRGDLWDERPSPKHLAVKERFTWSAMQQMVAENRMAEFNEVFDSNYDYDGPPTKLPAGRVELVLDPSQAVESFELNLATAEGIARFSNAAPLRGFVSADAVKHPFALFRIPGPAPREVLLHSPDSVKKLGYAPPRKGEAEGLRWFEQEGADGFAYAVCAAWRRVGDGTLLAMTVATRDEGQNPQAIAQARVKAALDAGYEALVRAHAQWWNRFWEESEVHVPEPNILRHYYLVRYFYGAASRRGAPPMPLQGVWTADAGTLPPWKGDYHNDLNTQMTYMGYQPAGHFDEGAAFLDLLWDLLPTFRRFARDFYDAPGAAVPGVMSLKGQALGGWGQYSLSPTMGAWNAHLFYLHWRYTGDDQFLRPAPIPGAARSPSACCTCSSPIPTACSNSRSRAHPKSSTIPAAPFSSPTPITI
jgi:alpha-L-fucosidase 2